MTTFAGISPVPAAAVRIATPPPTAASATVTPLTPPTGVSQSLVVDLTEASRLTAKAVEMIGTLPPDDVGLDSTKDLRIRIYKTSMAAQSRLERQFDAQGNDASVTSALRQADAYLEDTNWQLAKKPSPDGRFNGVDVPGALRDASEAARVINDLLRAAGGHPTDPTPLPTDPPTHPPSGPPSPPSFPPPGTGGGGGQLPPTDPDPIDPTRPPGRPEEPQPPSAPDGGGSLPPDGVDPDYPGEDEFPKDDEILGGGDS